MKDNLIINGIEYTPVQKTKDPEPRAFLLRPTTPPDSPNRVWSDEVEVLYENSRSALHNGETVRVVECPVGSVVISYRDLLYAWDYSADKFGDAPNFLKMCKILKVLK